VEPESISITYFVGLEVYTAHDLASRWRESWLKANNVCCCERLKA
jgi:hypothetical protein